MREIRFHLIERIKTKTFLQGLNFYAGYGLRNIFQTGKNHSEELLTEEMTEEKIVENFHKLYYENGERIAFSGSINETGRGWYDNKEQFNAYRSWGDDTNNQGISSHQKDFNNL